MGLLDFFKDRPNINKLKAKKNIQGLIKALFFKKDNNIRMEAAKVLGDLKDKTAVETLISALKDWSPKVRYFAAESLGKIGDPRAVDCLIEALKDSGSWIVDYKYGASNRVADSAAIALADIGDLRATDPIFNDYPGNYKIPALARLGDKRAIDLMCKDNYLRPEAAERIIEMGKKHTTFLVHALKCNQRNLVSAAGKLLKELNYNPKELKDKLLFYLASKNDTGILELGETAISYLADFLTQDIFREKSIRMISEIGGPLAEKELEGYLYQGPAVKIALINLYKKQGATDKVLKILQESPTPDVKKEALSALIDLKDSRLSPILIDLLDSGLADFAANMLGEIGDSRAIEPLIKKVKEFFFVEGLIALAKIGDERAAEAIIDAIFSNFDYFWITNDRETREIERWRGAFNNSPWLGKYGSILARITAVKKKEYSVDVGKETKQKHKEYDTQEVSNAIYELGDLGTPIAINILHKFLTIKDYEVEVSYLFDREEIYNISYMKLFEAECSIVRKILSTHSYSHYDQKAYLNKKLW